MKSFLRSFLASLMSILVLAALVLMLLVSKFDQTSKLDKDSYLVVDIYGSVPEYADPGGVVSGLLGDDGETLQRILSNLEKVTVDDRIEGVILKLSSANDLGWASMEEIRHAIGKVQAADKQVFGYADSIDNKTYFLAAACDELFAPPTAYISFTGFASVRFYVKDGLEKLGIEPNIHRIKDYKAAAELVTRDDMSEFARENTTWMMEEFKTAFMEVLQQDRGLAEERVLEIMSMAELTGEEAVELGLFDELAYLDQLCDRLKGEKDDELRVVSQTRYAEEDPADLGLKGKKKIAVIHAHGTIGGRQSRVDPMLGSMMGHETVAQDFRRARDDEDVVAVVFRVDSGGGESLTSDMIGRAITWTREEKPVVVSMVNVAASGGYHIAHPANKIVADRLTITGSIGSITGKFNMAGLYDKLGISHDFVAMGPMATYNFDFQNFTPEQLERFERSHWDSFNLWLTEVAKDRGMSFADAEKLAHGRVWTGRQAEGNGLVDAVGGLDKAIEVAKELAELDAEEKVTLVHYPEEEELLDMVLGGGDEASLALRSALAARFRAEAALTVHSLQNGRFLIAPEVEIR